jgi:hypothetical protein
MGQMIIPSERESSSNRQGENGEVAADRPAVHAIRLAKHSVLERFIRSTSAASCGGENGFDKKPDTPNARASSTSAVVA